ncbi:acetolactate synthase large subunit [Salinisphaera sp. USBA-960]|uniref:acetolactate synthase large subunit n=1 Tax=Salinisphaera orenii TaxID=856731 RepID=UPI000DBE27C5|nr:acetolactate synthase large subunit [Salifodinibacter halophilus]NNC26123.1 acetolactate synthase large subunit [Salifodinibacter halophilus]
MKASDLFVACLEQEGVEYVFGVPGEENLDLIESLRTSGITLIVTRHEQHAAFMAATYGRLTGRAGVCLSTLGPGATNLLTGIAYAQLGGMPLFAITGQKPIRDNTQGGFQLIDIVHTFAPQTKWNDSITDGAVIPRSIRHAFKVAEAERPGATHLELPEDIAGEEVGDMRPQGSIRTRPPIADESAIDSAAEAIASARQPILIYSAGTNRETCAQSLARFVEKTGIYAVGTQMGKGVLAEDHEQSLFCMGIHQHDYVHTAIDEADLVITVGYSPIEYPPYVWNPKGDKRIIDIDYDTTTPDEFYSPEQELLGLISSSLDRLRSRLIEYDFGSPRFARLREYVSEKLHIGHAAVDYPPSPAYIVDQVRLTLDRYDIISLDNGIYKIWFARLYPAYIHNTVLLDNALASMGAGLGAAMAARLVHPDRQVLAVCGDGGFEMNSQDLETAVRLQLDMVVLIVRDCGYGFIRWKQQSAGFTDFGMGFGNPDFVALAQAYGANGIRHTGEQTLSTVLTTAFEQPGVTLVECAVNYDSNSELSNEYHVPPKVLDHSSD